MVSSLYSAEPFPVVCCYDPAIDPERSRWREYLDKLDLALLVPKPGEAFTVFWISRLTTSEALKIQQHATADSERYEMAFRAALLKVENLTDRDGTEHALFTPTRAGQSRSMSAADLDRFDVYDVQEVGAIALQRGFLGPRKPLIFARPPSSGVAWARIAEASPLAEPPSTGTHDSTSSSEPMPS